MSDRTDRILVRAGKDPRTPLSAERSLSISSSGVFGTNAGNMLFYTAAWRTLLTDRAELVADGYALERGDPAWAAGSMDRVVIPLANAFRRSFVAQLDRLTEVVRGLRVPVTVLGIGAQSGLNAGLASIPSEL